MSDKYIVRLGSTITKKRAKQLAQILQDEHGLNVEADSNSLRLSLDENPARFDQGFVQGLILMLAATNKAIRRK